MQSGVGAKNTFQTDNHNLSVVWRENGMISWMVENLILRKTNVALKYIKTLIRPHTEYCTHA